ncbi:MAG: acyl-CoA dehydrogenase family protein, partial [Dehalococcoidia bacterium]
MTTATPEEARSQIVNLVRDFVRRDVEPVAAHLDQEDIVPLDLIDKMKDLGLFGITVPEEYGGMGLDYTTFARIFEELSKGFMSITGAIGTHHIMTYVLTHYGSEEQKRHFLPDLAAGRKRGGLALTEPGGGSDVANLELTADKDGEEYVLNGTKMFITNGRYGDTFCLLARTDRAAEPRHRGISCFIVEKGGDGFRVGRDLDKLGYRGLDTCELIFEDYRIPVENLVGHEEGKGFGQVMSGLETGRINVAARAVGVAQAAFEASMRYSQQRQAFGVPISQHQAIQLKLADMATKIQAARLLTYDAAAKKDSGERVDLESGMAKLFASEACQEVTMEAMR